MMKKNNLMQNFSFVNHMNQIEIGDSRQIDYMQQNINSTHSSPIDQHPISNASSEKHKSFASSNLDHIHVASFLKDNTNLATFLKDKNNLVSLLQENNSNNFGSYLQDNSNATVYLQDNMDITNLLNENTNTAATSFQDDSNHTNAFLKFHQNNKNQNNQNNNNIASKIGKEQQNNQGDFAIPLNPLQNKKVFQNMLKINSSIDTNPLNNPKLIRNQTQVNNNINSNITSCKQSDINTTQFCQSHTNKIIKYHLISNPLVQFCSKCALEFAVNGVKIEKNENLRDKKIDYDNTSIKISQSTKDSSLLTMTKNTQPDTQQTLYTEQGHQPDQVTNYETYKNEKLRLFLERVGYTNECMKMSEETIMKKIEETNEYLKQEEESIMNRFNEIMESIERERKELLTQTKVEVDQTIQQFNEHLSSLSKYYNEINQYSEDISINIKNIIQGMEKQPFDDIIDRYNARVTEINTFANQFQYTQLNHIQPNHNISNNKLTQSNILPNVYHSKQNSLSNKDFNNHNNNQNISTKESFIQDLKPKISSSQKIKQKVMSNQNSNKSSFIKNNYKILPLNSLNKSCDDVFKSDKDCSYILNTSLNSSGINLAGISSSSNACRKQQLNLLNNSFSHSTSLSNNNNNNNRSNNLHYQKLNTLSIHEPSFTYSHQHPKTTHHNNPNQLSQKIHDESTNNDTQKENGYLKQYMNKHNQSFNKHNQSFNKHNESMNKHNESVNKQNESINKHKERMNKDRRMSNQNMFNPSRRTSIKQKEQFQYTSQENTHQNPHGNSTHEFIQEEEYLRNINRNSLDNAYQTQLQDRISANNQPHKFKIIGHRNESQNLNINSHTNYSFNPSSLQGFSNHSGINNTSNYSQNNNYNNNNNNMNESVYRQVLKTMKGKVYQQSKQDNQRQNNRKDYLASHNNSINNNNNNSHFNSMNTDLNDVNVHNISITNKENSILNVNSLY